MKGTTKTMNNSIFFHLILGVLAAGIVYASLAGIKLPLIAGPRASLLALLIVGLAMCSSGIMQVSASGNWLSLFAITGYLLGASILVVFVSSFTGWKLPLIQNETQALVAMAVLMAVKYLVGIISPWLHVL